MSRGKSALIGLAFILALGAVGLFFTLRAGDPWPLVYKKDGGLAGFAQELRLQENGEAVFTDLVSGDEQPFTAEPDDMQRIERALEEVDWDEVEGSRTVEGADILFVTIEFGGNRTRGALMSEEEKSLLPLIGLLDQVIAKSRL